MGKIGVIGATGTVGKELIFQLKKEGHDFSALIRNLEKGKDLLGKDVELRLFSFGKEKENLPSLKGINRLFLLGPGGIANFSSKLKSLIHTAKEAGIQHIVTMTGMKANENPDTWMGKIEEMIKDSGMNWTFLRPNWFMQNFDTFFGCQIRDQKKILLPAGEAKTSFIDVRDIAACAKKVLTEKGHEKKGYTLTGPEALTHHDVAKILSNQIGHTITYHPQTEEDIIRIWQHEGWPLPLIEELLLLYRHVRKEEFAEVSLDVEHLLGRKPLSFQKYVKDFASIWTLE